jgi:hypothetical protein
VKGGIAYNLTPLDNWAIEIGQFTRLKVVFLAGLSQKKGKL